MTDDGGYRATRGRLLAAGVAVLLVTALVTWLRGVDPVEVTGVLLFLPVFVVAVLTGTRGGLAAGVVAAVVYALLRAQALPLTTFTSILPTVGLRVVGYLVFGGLGGWAAQVVGRGIDKLERFDVTDDETELLNARGLHQQLAQEHARAQRYGSAFTVVTVTYDPGEHAAARQARIGQAVRASVRSVDDVGRAQLLDRQMLVAVLPETPREGAEVVGEKLRTHLAGATEGARGVTVDLLVHPEDDEAITALLERLESAVQREFPTA